MAHKETRSTVSGAAAGTTTPAASAGFLPSIRKLGRQLPQQAKTDCVAIVGGGVIGCSTAYFLSQLGVQSHLFEGTGVASSSSGKAGGFLARDWCSGAVDKLARCSFDLHAELAKELGTSRIGYRAVTTTSVSTAKRSAAPSSRASRAVSGVPSWLGSPDSAVLPVGSGSLGTPGTTAQVHPAHLTAALAEHSAQSGCSIINAHVVSITHSVTSATAAASPGKGGDSAYSIHTADGAQHGPYSRVVLAMGAWAERANAWLPGVVPAGWKNVKVHSVVLQGPPTDGNAHQKHSHGAATRSAAASPPTDAFPPTMLFVHDGAQGLEPEVYPRPCGEVYTCDISSDTPVPDTPAQVQPDAGACEQLEAFLRGLGGGMGCEKAFPLKAAQACYLPYAPDETPIVGPSKRYPGVFIGAGHSCWGILLGPATGMLLAHQCAGLPVAFLPPAAVQQLAPRHAEAEEAAQTADAAQADAT